MDFNDTFLFAATVAGMLLATIALVVYNERQCKKAADKANRELAECNRRLAEAHEADEAHKIAVAEIFKKHLPMSPHAIVTRKAEVPVDHPPTGSVEKRGGEGPYC